MKNYKLASDEILVAWGKSPDSVDLLAELIDIEIILKDFATLSATTTRTKRIVFEFSNHIKQIDARQSLKPVLTV